MFGRKVDRRHKVCGVTSGGEHPPSGTGLVDRAAVSLLYSKVLYSVGLQPDLHSGQGTVKVIFIIDI